MGRWERLPLPTLLIVVVLLGSTTQGEAANLHLARRRARETVDEWKGSQGPFGAPNLEELPFLPMTSSMGLFEVVVGQRSRHYEPPIDKDVSGSADVITGRNAAILQSPRASQAVTSGEQQLVAAASTVAEVANRTPPSPQQQLQTPQLFPITQPVIFTAPIQTVAAPQFAQPAASAPRVAAPQAPKAAPLIAPQTTVPVAQQPAAPVVQQVASPYSGPTPLPLTPPLTHPVTAKLAPPIVPPPSLQLPLIPQLAQRPPQLAQQHPPVEEEDEDEEEDQEDEDDEEKPIANEVAAKEAVEEDDEEDDDDDEVKAEPEERFDSSTLRKTPKYFLPAGSFMLPAVGKNHEEYYSKTEQALYIPLKSTDQGFPVQTQVVLVQPTAESPAPESPEPINLYHHKEDESQVKLERPRPLENIRALVRPYHGDPVGGAEHPSRPKSAPGPLDLVMTVYPNLPALLPQSQSNHGVKSVHEPKAASTGNAPPSGGSMSVIHEVKVITPPQGYLPALLKPQQKQQQEAAATIGGQPSATASGNDPITELKAPTGTSDSHASASTNSVAATRLAPYSPLVQVHAPSPHHSRPATGDQTGHASGVNYVAFTPDDVGPSNAVAHGPSTDRNDALLPPQDPFSSSQVLSQGQVHDVNNQQGSVQVIPMSFADGRLTLSFGEGSREPHHIDHLQLSKPPATGTPQSPQLFHVAGPTAEVVIGSKFQTFPSDQSSTGGQSQHLNERRPQPLSLAGQASDIVVTGYFNHPHIPNDGGIPVFGIPSYLPNQLNENIKPAAVQDKSDSPHFRPVDDELVTGRPNADQLIPFHAQTGRQVPGTVIHQDGRPDASQYIKPALPQLHGDFKPMLDHDQPLYAPPVHDLLESVKEDDKPNDQPAVKEDEEEQEEDEGEGEDDQVEDEDDAFSSPENGAANAPVETVSTTTPVSEEDELPVSHLQASHADGPVAESKIHEGASHEEKSPQVIAIKQELRGPKHHHHHRKPAVVYKPGKSSPKGAMYTVTQGHSKVKFFGFNALHKAMRHPDGTYILYTEDPDWKSSPYLPLATPSMDSIAGGTLVKRIPKKSVSISAKQRALRP